MKIFTRSPIYILGFLLIPLLTTAQYAPGGIGDGSGASGPRNVIWLDASTLGLSNDDPVTSWPDQSGNGNDLVQQGTDAVPFFRNDGLSGSYDVVRFDDTERYLTLADNASLDGSTGISIIIVSRSFTLDGSPRGIISKRNSSSSEEAYSVFSYSSDNLYMDVRTTGDNRLSSGTSLTENTDYILSCLYDGSLQSVAIQSTVANTANVSGNVNDASSDLILGALNDNYGTYFDGDIAEVIVYNEGLTYAERIIIENYLSNKYNISIGGNDHWSDNATYSNEIAGIGQESTNSSQATSAASAALRISGGDDLSDDEWIFWGHDNTDFTSYTSTEIVTGTSQQRLAREWLVEETGDLGDVTVSISTSDIPATGLLQTSYYLLVDDDGDFSNATPYLMEQNGSSFEVSVDLSDGQFLAFAYEPTIPAGVGGTLSFWFSSDNGVENTGSPATNGQSVTIWQDLSANNYDGVNGTSPTFFDATTINYNPVVEFDAASSQYLEFDITDLEGADYTLLAVGKRNTGSANQYILGSQDNQNDALFLGYSGNTQLDGRNSGTASVNTTVSAFDNPIETPFIAVLDYNSTNLTVDEFRDGTNNNATQPTSTDYAATGYTGNLGRALGGNYFDGYLSEIVGFSTSLSTADKNALISNIAIKYGVNTGIDYTDELGTILWDLSDNGAYTSDVVAIGFDASFELDQRISKSETDSLVLASNPDFTSLNSDASRVRLSDGQFIFLSNDSDPLNLDQSYNGNNNVRLDRTWRVREIGAPGNVILAIPSSIDVNVMLVSSDQTFSSGVTEVGLLESGGYNYANYDFADGDYVTFISDPSEVWYSYLSGNWNNPANWTLDGAVSPLYVNPDNKVPTVGDSVVIKSGRTITADINNITIGKVELIGTFDLASTNGHDFGFIEGNGRLRLAGSGGSDNYPAGVDTLFYDSQEGGTVEYYGSGYALDQTRRFNNLTINLTSDTDLLTQLADSIYVFGDLLITNGIYQINDNSATNNLVLEVYEDLTIESTGGFDVGTANARHELNLYGDFTNQGEAYFTNRTSQSTGSDAGNGIIDFNFVSDNQNQVVDLQNTTNFYRLEVNKGVDDTYSVRIDADDPGFFELYGRANVGHGAVAQLDPDNDENLNAVGLYYGNLILGSNVDVGPLNTGGNYNISEGAKLTIDGGSANKTGGTAIVPYGTIEVNSGTLTADVNSGITTRGNGLLIVNGGTVTMRQMRTSVFGSTNQGGLIQTGGIINFTGGSVNGNYFLLNLTYTGNVFNITGGTMNFSDVGTKGGIFINSSAENVNVTGGTINVDVNNGNDFLVSSRAPFYNLIVRESSATAAEFRVDQGQSGPGGNDETVENLPLRIFNDLTIDNSDGNGTTFNPNGNNVEVTGTLLIENGASVDFSDMTLIFNNEGSSTLDIELGTTLILDSLEINKNITDVEVTIVGGQQNALQIDHYLNINNGIFNIDTFDITVNGALNMSDTIGTPASTGIVFLTGSATQDLTSDEGLIYDLEINNPNGIDLTGDFVVDTLHLEGGVFDINTHKLTILNDILTTGSFGTTLMVQTAGNASDGGLEFYFDGNTADPSSLLFPIGTDANSSVRYTPSNLDLENVTDDGYISISLADSELSSTDPSGGNILQFYWQMDHREFTTQPDITTVDFSAENPAAIPASSVPGKGEGGEDSDDTPTTDIAFDVMESPGSIVNEVITFTGNDVDNGVGSFTLTRASYTAGEAGRFATSPTVFYTRKTTDGDQNWNVAANWSNQATGHNQGGTGNVPAASRYPGQGGNTNDIVIIGAHDSDRHGFSQEPVRLDVNINTDVAAVIFEETEAGESRGRLFPQQGTNHSWGEVSGNGEIQLFFTNSGNVPTFDQATTDFGDFLSETESTWNLAHQGGAGKGNRVTMPSFPSTFPNLRVTATGGGNGGADGWGNQRIVEFTNDITINNELQVANRAALYVQSDISIADDLRIGGGFGHGRLRFPNGSTSYTVSVGGDVVLGETTGGTEDDNFLDIESGNANNTIHSLLVSGNIILEENGNGTDGIIDLFVSSTENKVNLILEGANQSTFTNNTDQTPDLYRIVLNKGTDTTSSFTINSNFALNGDNSVEPQAVELQNGKLVINNSTVNLNLADNSDFTIPSTAGLDIRDGTITTTDAKIILDGLFRVGGGMVDLDNTAIEYSNSGSSLLNISGGTLDVGYQIRRATTSTSGILKYRQTGGDVDIATDGAPENSRSILEVLNPGSDFTFTGGTLNLFRGVTGDANESLELNPSTFDLTGSTITIFENLGSNYGSNYFNIKSEIALDGLVIANTIDLPDVRLYTKGLTVNNLTINANQVLTANGFNLTVSGDFTNNGTYTNQSSETIFNTSSTQTIDGAGTFTIFDFRKTGSGTTNATIDLDVDNNFYLDEGTLDIGSNAINLSNNAFIESTLTNSGGNGLVFSGTSSQNLSGLSNNTVEIGTITINNAAGVDISDGNGYNFNISQELRLDGGVFNIGGSLLTLLPGAEVTEVSPFNVNNMVQTNSSFTDNGLRIEFFTVDADTTIFFPVGELKYTPVQFDLNAGTGTGSIRVRPANERHPTIVDDTEPMPETEIDDTQNVLQYHWIVVAENIANATGDATFFYDHGDIAVTAPYDTSNYISARLLSNDINWDKFAPTLFDGSSLSFAVPLDQGSGVTSNEITGDYTAGVGSSDGINNNIEGAIPNQIASYETQLTGSGDYSTAANWNPLNGSPAVTDGVGPVGAQITVQSGDTITLDISNIRLFSTQIESGGTLIVPSGVTGIRLGTVTGTGKIILNDTELLPTGEYTDFFSCSGGVIQYSGSTSYNVLSGISQLRKVILDGTGTRSMPNNNITVCDSLVINGPTVAFNSGLSYSIGDSDDDRLEIQAGTVSITNGSSIDIDGDFVVSGGSLTGANGTDIELSDDLSFTGGSINWNGTSVTLDGSTEQLIDGNLTGSAGFDDLTINNSSSAGVTINSGDIEVSGVLTLTDGFFNTTASETLTLTSSGSFAGATTASYITGPVTKQSISALSTFRFPVGKTVRYAPASIVDATTGSQNWTVEYFTSTNPSFPNSQFDATDPGSGYNELLEVKSTDRWEITSSGSNSARIRTTYGSHNNFLSADDIRVVWWDGSESRWENQGGQVNGDENAGTVTSENSISFSTQQFGLGNAPESTLPVTLVDFYAETLKDVIRLKWSTASEVNNDYFEILRSRDGQEFEVIGIVDGNGNSDQLINYSFTDNTPLVGTNYYQLRQVDYDGQFEFSPIIRTRYELNKEVEVQVYPNPAITSEVNIVIQSENDNINGAYILHSIDGKIIYQGAIERREIQLDVSSLKEGIYFIKIHLGSRYINKRLIKTDY